MEAGDYLLMNGISVKIIRANDRFVVLDSGHSLTREQAQRFKHCSARPESGITYTQTRRVGKTFITKQIDLMEHLKLF
ncbi:MULTISPECIES: hypothetical protein [unclassified Pseudodesulfovibrio]|uniref:hypothetical protein n=1 Tax=unclassified Pseudodesulfovibrio TaxID=2661612 RepID=UPI000FEBF5BD|nr:MULTISPECIES: hypothetical protein [unclassified Pseudodesulfovibrio]MCJ2164638.1 hypothetical protein [Pseudodesulfovibrio sp. S3-i]RWU04170.1 hypothetical protein DWB63_09185 [Pseudodesulfovibrio sp. S3]